MKVLYVGNWKDGTGWAHAAQGYILALDAVNIDVVPRFIKLNSVDGEVPKRILELEEQDDKNCDVIIQHVLPHMLDYNGSFDRNIAIYVTETSHCNNTVWPERLNIMDETWVPNKQMVQNSYTSKICTPTHIVPHAFDMSKYQKSYAKLEIPELKDKFVFYYIGEINKRKNLGTIIKAFHLEFSREEDVALVLKAHLPGRQSQESEACLKELCDNIKDGLKLYPSKNMYHNEIFLCQYLTDEQIMRIHSTCDCFVSATFGEAWGIPIFDAMAMGKTPICTSTGGPNDYLETDQLINSNPEPCFGMVDTFAEMYVGNENWDQVNLQDLRSTMRKAFSDREWRTERSATGINKAYQYSYASVGSKMFSILNGEDDLSDSWQINYNMIHGKHSIEELISVN